MSATPYHPHPGNAATQNCIFCDGPLFKGVCLPCAYGNKPTASTTDDSNGWETPPQPKRLTFARITQLHARAQSDATIHVRLPIHTYGQHASVQEDDIYAFEFFKARIRLTHPAHPPGHTTALTGPEATLGTIEHLRPYLLDGTALFASAPVAVAITRPALLACADPAGEIDAAIAWLQVFKAAGLNPKTTTNPGQA